MTPAASTALITAAIILVGVLAFAAFMLLLAKKLPKWEDRP